MLTLCLFMCSTVDPMARGGGEDIIASGQGQGFARYPLSPMFRVSLVLQWVPLCRRCGRRSSDKSP